jgi:hypothetical protein
MNTREKKKLRHKYIEKLELKIEETKNLKYPIEHYHPITKEHGNHYIESMNILLKLIKEVSFKDFFEIHEKKAWPGSANLDIRNYHRRVSLLVIVEQLMQSDMLKSITRDILINDLLTD